MKSSTQYSVPSASRGRLSTQKKLPRLYAIVDASMFEGEESARQKTLDYVRELLAGGATLIQYRNKKAAARELLDYARELRRATWEKAIFILNDRADFCLASGCDGVHVGQEDLSVEAVRRVTGEGSLIGVSTHNLEQILEAEKTTADYVAVGPIFATTTKTNPGPVVGLDLVRAARKATSKPLVAIGGITRANCRSVIEAGADSVAVISDLQESPREKVREFLQVLK